MYDVGVGVLKTSTETEAFVYYKGKDVSDKFDFKWTVPQQSTHLFDEIQEYYYSVGTNSWDWKDVSTKLDNSFVSYAKKIRYKTLIHDSSTAILTVKRKSDEEVIGRKVFKVSKVISPVTYKLVLNPTHVEKNVETPIEYKVYAKYAANYGEINQAMGTEEEAPINTYKVYKITDNGL